MTRDEIFVDIIVRKGKIKGIIQFCNIQTFISDIAIVGSAFVLVIPFKTNSETHIFCHEVFIGKSEA